jgi:hypothetical protein
MPAKKCLHCKQKRCRWCSTQDLETDHWAGDFVHRVVKGAGDAASSAADTMLVNSYFKAKPERFQELVQEAKEWKEKSKTQEFSVSHNNFLVDADLIKKI